MSGVGGPLPCDPRPLRFGHEIHRRGYGVIYRENETNYCPGCGRTHWYVGRASAECGFCGTALPLADAGTWGVGLIRVRAAGESPA